MIFQHVNNLCKKIDLDKALTTAYGIYKHLKEAQPALEDSVNELLGLSLSGTDAILCSNNDSRENDYKKTLSTNLV